MKRMTSRCRNGGSFARLATTLTIAVGTACAGNPSAGGSAGFDMNLITAGELREASHGNVYEAVDNLRPNWLRACCPDSFSNPSRVQAYVDDVKMSAVEDLRSIPVQGVQYIRWFSAVEASSRWGLDHGAGAIYVSLR